MVRIISKEFPTLRRLLGSKWLNYMMACESSRPFYPKKLSYVGNLSELERSLSYLEAKLCQDPNFSILLDFLKAGMKVEKWEIFEHSFAMLKEIEFFTKKHPNSCLELFPLIKEKEMDFRSQIDNKWVYFEVKASPMFSYEGEFIDSKIEKRISKK